MSKSKLKMTGRLIDRAVAARLVEADQVESYLSGLSAADRENDDAVVEHLIDAGRLTHWQVKCLEKGHSRFFIQEYKLLDFLGKGGMGIVYRAVHTLMDREVALKVLTSKRLSKDIKARFLREVRVSAKLHHPNVVATHDAGESGSTVFMAMELVRGRELAEVVEQEGAFDPQTAVAVIRQALTALAYAHSQRIVHRDIKPQNIMLTESDQVKILDLGLARVNSDEQDVLQAAALTQDGQLLGTPLYMSPEQIESARSADIRSDIYSLGCTFFFLLTGKHAFAADSLPGIIRRHAEGRPAKLEDHCPKLPRRLIALFGRMTACDPNDRFQTPSEVLKSLDEAQAEVDALPPAPAKPDEQTAADCRSDESAPKVKLPKKRGKHRVFISYRREGGADLARSIHTELLRRGHSAFLDVVSLRNSYFDDRLLDEIEATPNFVLILTPGCLERCQNPNDWLRREIAHAIKHQRNIVPIIRAGFIFPENLPSDIASLSRYNGIEYYHRWFDAAMTELLKFSIDLDDDGDKPDESEPDAPGPDATETETDVGDGDNRGDSVQIGRFDVPLVTVPAGSFQAGCDRDTAQSLVENLAIANAADIIKWLSDSGVQTRTVEAFRISQFTVTNEIYSEFVSASGHAAPANWPSGRFARGDERKPVTGVNLGDAEAFCRWAGVRLPSPDEWEKAARGDAGSIYPWGNSFNSDYCRSAETSASGPVEVEQNSASDSPYGVRQCAGNVWEWNAPAAEGTVYIRGGSYMSSCSIYGAGFVRMIAERGIRRNDFGFRIVVDGGGKNANRRQTSSRPVDRDTRSHSSTETSSPPQQTPSHQTSPPIADRPARQTSAAADIRRDIERDLLTVPPGAFLKGFSRSSLDPVAKLVGLQEAQLQQLIGNGLRQVTVPAFQIARLCVTNAQYLAFVRERNIPAPAGWDAGIVEGRTNPDTGWLSLPVCPVNYEQANEFCQWLGFRLPKVDEWEKAARGADDDRVFPWGNQFDAARCNGAESNRGAPVAVDAYSNGKSPFGLLNATGNVFEFLDPQGQSFAGLRGGSFQVSCSVYGLIGHEMAVQRSHTEPSFGFRVAR